MEANKQNNLDMTSNSDRNYSNLNMGAAIIVFLNILISTILFLYFVDLRKDLDDSKPYSSVYWKNSDSTEVKSGPSWFLIDSKNDSLKSLKAINDNEKIQLLNLAVYKENSLVSYNSAIDKLAFESNSEIKGIYYIMLLLSAICGAMGVQLRNISNFIGVACYKKAFDFKIWWPWYMLRPILGGLIGSILFILINGNLFTNQTATDYSEFTIIALSVLAGFGAEDFLGFLRNLSKRIFGTEPK